MTSQPHSSLTTSQSVQLLAGESNRIPFQGFERFALEDLKIMYVFKRVRRKKR